MHPNSHKSFPLGRNADLLPNGEAALLNQGIIFRSKIAFQPRGDAVDPLPGCIENEGKKFGMKYTVSVGKLPDFDAVGIGYAFDHKAAQGSEGVELVRLIPDV